MKSSKKSHRARPWRVHTLAADFEVIDVDTTRYEEASVAQIIAEEIRGRLGADVRPKVRTCA